MVKHMSQRRNQLSWMRITVLASACAFTSGCGSNEAGLTPGDAKILDELKKPTKIEFIETPLKEVMEFISEAHGIKIQFDESALKEAGLGSDTVVPNVSLIGTSLNSALRQTLGKNGSRVRHQ